MNPSKHQSSKHHPSRRDFVARSSMLLAGAALGIPRALHASSRGPLDAILLPVNGRQPVLSYGPELLDPAHLRALAQHGIDAAMQAGASYADIRVGDSRTLTMYGPGFLSGLWFELLYGLRVRVGGGWAFAAGGRMTTDAIAQSARSAVDTARGLDKLSAQQHDFVPAPVVTGEWTAPIRQDPFTTAPDDLAQILGAYTDAAHHVPDADLTSEMRWTKDVRVFASSEGSLVTQHLMTRIPKIRVSAMNLPGRRTAAALPLSGVLYGSYGLDGMVGADVQERVRATAEECVRLNQYPEVPVEVGRFPAVVDSSALGMALAATIGQALGMDRVLGNEADETGTSSLAPIESILGQPLFSPLLTVTADRSMPHMGAVKWDDEGVPTETFPVVNAGRVVDYFTTRSNASQLSTWYATQGRPLASRGSAFSLSPSYVPRGLATHLIMATGAEGMTLDALVKGMGNGLLLRGVADVTTDNGLNGGAMYPIMLYTVKRGQIVNSIRGGLVQFGMKSLWKALAAVGDASTVEPTAHDFYLSETFTALPIPVSAPAAQFRQLDVIQT